jgi:alkanesulfonate monooxygenase SsuD/methylene tetrahydromethanopterin reductase-like flavin-dependent oxidoreductase (luciferase family)
LVLPHFRADPGAALTLAAEADRLGIHGVFCYDHIWPMGQPTRPALAPFPLLARIGSVTGRVCLGTLVARVGLVTDEVLLSQFRALDDVAPGRVVAGLGTGDRQSAIENRAYGLGWEPAAERRASLRRCAGTLRDEGFPVWIGGGAPATVAVAEAEEVAVNLWAATPEEVARQAARTETTWGGPVPPGRDDADAVRGLAVLIRAVAAAGAAWAVVGYPSPIGELADLAAELGD